MFPRWLLEVLGAERELFHPAHYDLAGRLVSERGPIPASALVAGEVCEACNHGWMSRLEQRFKRVAFERRRQGEIGPGEREVMAHWFSKTAVVINTSQNWRLMVPRNERHALARGVPPGFDVYLARWSAGRRRLNFAQGQRAVATMPAGVGINPDSQFGAGGRVQRLYACVIQVQDLVGLVVYAPPDHWAHPVERMARLWPLENRRLTWGGLPRLRDWLDAEMLEGDLFRG
jgi:hypothetical protein